MAWHTKHEAVPYNPRRWYRPVSYANDLEPALAALFARLNELRVGIHEVSRRSGVGVTTIKSWAVGRYKPSSKMIFDSVCESVGMEWIDGTVAYRTYYIIGGRQYPVGLPYCPKNGYHQGHDCTNL